MNHVWPAAAHTNFALAVAEILRQWKDHDIDADEAMARVSYEYVDKIGELE